MRSFRRWLCAILVLAMVCGLMPMTTYATEPTEPEETVVEEQPVTNPDSTEQPESEAPEQTEPETAGQTEPETAEQTEPETLKKGDIVSIPFQVNPHYEGIYTADDFPASQQEQLYQGELYASTTYLTVAKAGEAVRKAMKNRQESVTVKFKTTSSSSQTAGEEVMAEAIKHTGKALEGDYLEWQYGGWRANILKSFNSSTNMYEYDCTFFISYYTTAEQEAELTTAVNQLKKDLKLSSKSNYDKIFAVYDYMCQNITYDHANLNDSSYKLKHTAYAALINKTAVCQGYALLFYRIMLELGIDCRIIAGYGNGGAHGWNIVKLDGLYYNLDATWDAGYDEYIWFLNSYWDFGDHERNPEYDTISFHNKYPIAAESYQKGVTGTKDPYISVGYAGAQIDNVIWYLGRDGSITFKGAGEMYEFSSANQPYYSYFKDEITKVVVEEGITGLGEYSFYKFPALEEVAIASSVTNIGESCFYHCDKLEKVSLPEELMTIERNAFAYSGLPQIQIPEKVTTIGEDAFAHCDNLTEIVIPASVTSLSGFKSCENLERVELHNSGRVDSYAFYHCGKLSSINFPEGITYIGGSAFQYCESLTDVSIPRSVTYLGTSAFYGCKNLKTATLNNRGGVQAHCFSMCQNLSSVILGEEITSISSCAFDNCIALMEITFQGSAPSIDNSAFRGVTATAYYPLGNKSWTEDVMQNYGGTITWERYGVCTDHEYSAVVTNPTCTEGGFTTYTCTICGESYVGDEVEPVAHSYEGVVTDPTCTESGFTTYTCTICGESYVGDEVEPVAHSYEGVVTDPTCAKRGFTTYTCTVCGDSYDDDYVDALGHKFENEVCTVCGRQEHIPGDMDGSGTVDVDDVLALLWHVLFPEEYFIEAEADFDSSKTVDVDDVLALLWHVLFPEQYPLT